MKKLNFWSAEESFFLLEILPDERLSGIFLETNADKKLSPVKIWESVSWADLASRLDFKRFIKNIVIAADSSLTYAAIVPVRLLRESPNIPLFSTELENMLAQEVGKVFNHCRVAAGRELGVDDLDIVLANSRVGQFKLDGHHVLNPIGLRAKKVEAVLELMLTTRPLFDLIRSFLKNRQHFFFTEISRAELIALEKVQKLPLRLLRLEHPRSSAVVMKDAVVGREMQRMPIAWSTESLFAAVMREWGVSRATARAIYEAYCRRDMSPASAKFFTKIFAGELEPLFAEIQKPKLKGTIFVETPLDLPLDLPVTRGQWELAYPPLDRILERSGFSYEPTEWPFGKSLLFRKLAPFLAFYHDRSDSTVNRWLRRHLNWLGSPMTHPHS